MRGSDRQATVVPADSHERGRRRAGPAFIPNPGAAVDPEGWRDLEALFHAAAALEPEARAAYVLRARRERPGLAAQLERLLDAADEADRFIRDIFARGGLDLPRRKSGPGREVT